MKRSILVFILLIFPIFSLAQSDTDKDQQELYALLFSNKLEEAKIFTENRFLKSENKSRQVIGYIYLAYYYKLMDEKDSNAQLLKMIQKAKDIAGKTGNEIDEAYVEYGNTIYYQAINKWDLYIKSFAKSVTIFKKHPHENFMLAMLYHAKFIALRKNHFEKRNIAEFRSAIKFAEESKSGLLLSIINTDTGNFYIDQSVSTQDTKYSDSAKVVFNKAFAATSQMPDSDIKKRLQLLYYCNIGATYLNHQDYNKALEYYNKGFPLYEDVKDKRYLYTLLNNIGCAYSLMGDSTTALEYYLKTEAFINDKQIPAAYKITLYRNIADAYEKLHKLDKALAYQKKLRETITEEDKRLYENNTTSLDTFYKTEQEKNILEEKNNAYKKYEIWYIGAIISTILGLIFLFFTLHYRQKLNKRTTKFLESEKEKLKIENELSMMKQEQLQKQALATSIQLEHKNTFINELKVNIPKDKKIEHLLKDEHLMDRNFNTIRDIIQETHPNFFKRLNELAKNKLTNLDLKYAAYIYLNMDNMQIATALKVDPKTVSVTKHRLKQKLEVNKEDDLNTFIRNLNY
ncbi:tetratricopeptide repeat-containing protein [Chryseobacterium lactis]|uniref:Tetratricopeptide repeat protein n=1 Tax=Chryseobacterium lactis TaxID=1241981 RepID=A0A3G6RIH7_CHRLC|nr:tetratricopeptide repeat protein [Chryseobacterium lactis]AZA83289.1 tetratricopeptide repeat protein [Chryseobacterium lactis]AZB03673.1 tetratricopeptide repeat protein [Chryseobacterium lactis]PNW11117.1 tetratricopeptide repeat-containing protein [Chryseobacterium lactis]